jgi:ATP-dependent exoDNAse (exonuclease V) alpha subunit
MLAWAVTIHKSQGKTLEKVRVDLTGGSFAPGQVYVALSRCTTLEGIELSQPIKNNDVRTDAHVIDFYRRL